MKNFHFPSPGVVAGLAAITVLSLLAAGCVSDDYRYGSTYGHYRSGYPQTTVVYHDYYDYYPAYGVYYSRNHREYVYRDRNRWVRRSRPAGISLDVLLASPSVRMDFHDAPWHHHHNVVKRYPRNWRPHDRDRDGRYDDRHDRRHDDRYHRGG